MTYRSLTLPGTPTTFPDTSQTFPWIRYFSYLSSTNSPRTPHGGLVLRTNAMEAWRNSMSRELVYIGAARSARNTGQSWYPEISGNHVERLRNEAIAKLRSKIYEGSAALGVTAGSYKQSREMVVKRSKQLTSKMSENASKLAAASVRQGPKLLASLHLEIIFGWVPLYGDIVAACTSVCQHADIQYGVRGSSRTLIDGTHVVDNGVTRRETHESYVSRVTHSYVVRVANPNLWLMERAGLLNVASVGWDLVPWSFVVNMFVNTGQLVNSITDYVGLEFSNGGETITSRGQAEDKYFTRELSRNVLSPGYAYAGNELTTASRKKRTLSGAPPRPTLQWKLPKSSWELAAIATSLLTQKGLSPLVRAVSQLNAKLPAKSRNQFFNQ